MSTTQGPQNAFVGAKAQLPDPVPRLAPDAARLELPLLPRLVESRAEFLARLLPVELVLPAFPWVLDLPEAAPVLLPWVAAVALPPLFDEPMLPCVEPSVA
jgi:hypothetical protein